ncbi:MAG: hypothetical protein LKG42_08440 [Eubacterium sp.]|jgi:endogenous inhibitor of DNA gyrase (YacG/DUF329 family)|nr:hypothetical protein [Eubacterium sp.]
MLREDNQKKEENNMKFPSILCEYTYAHAAIMNSAGNNLLDMLHLEMISINDVENGNISIPPNAVPVPPRILLKALFYVRFHHHVLILNGRLSDGNKSEEIQEKIFESSLKFQKDLEHYLSSFLEFLGSIDISQYETDSITKKYWKNIDGYRNLIHSLRIIDITTEEFMNFGNLRVETLDDIFQTIGDLDCKEMFDPRPRYAYDKPETKISAQDHVTVEYGGKEYDLADYIREVCNNQVGRVLSGYIVQYDTQWIPSILYNVTRNHRKLRRCANCGKPFIASESRRKYCSEACRKNIDIKLQQNKKSRQVRKHEQNYRQRFYKAYDRCHAKNKLSNFDLDCMNIPGPEYHGDPDKMRGPNKMRAHADHTLVNCLKRYNKDGFRKAINELIEFQNIRRAFGLISENEYIDWLDNSKIYSKSKRP